MKKQIALVFGSVNSEHDISVASAASVYEYFPHDVYDCVLLYIAKDGTFNVGDYTLEDMYNNDLKNHRSLYLNFDYQNPGFVEQTSGTAVSIDAAFLMLHGQMGEGGHVQGLLKCANIPFTGCDVLSSSLCMDKGFTHEVCEANGIPMAGYQLIYSLEDIDYSRIDYPMIVKPCREGSSFGVSIAHSKEELLKACEFAFGFDQRILIEDYIDGVEVGVSVLKTADEFIVSYADQVNVSGEIFDFQEKYHPHATETLPYALFPEEITEKIRMYSKQAFEILDCEQFARIDFFISKDHGVFFNEINTIPGFTVNSRYPSMIARMGTDYTTLITKLIEGAHS